ncbi:hypothetical protein ANN_22188 [Periplaneta americana]|uniref:Uncharacterized protein n=1 Tax=Periplaneta americana TaxID=6978 RepID=A0ABQ8S7F3_PERAM|nr:hypothetical protein ANN_22188 [Periplaneta americana]
MAVLCSIPDQKFVVGKVDVAEGFLTVLPFPSVIPQVLSTSFHLSSAIGRYVRFKFVEYDEVRHLLYHGIDREVQTAVKRWFRSQGLTSTTQGLIPWYVPKLIPWEEESSERRRKKGMREEGKSGRMREGKSGRMWEEEKNRRMKEERKGERMRKEREVGGCEKKGSERIKEGKSGRMREGQSGRMREGKSGKNEEIFITPTSGYYSLVRALTQAMYNGTLSSFTIVSARRSWSRTNHA